MKHAATPAITTARVERRRARRRADRAARAPRRQEGRRRGGPQHPRDRLPSPAGRPVVPRAGRRLLFHRLNTDRLTRYPATPRGACPSPVRTTMAVARNGRLVLISTAPLAREVEMMRGIVLLVVDSLRARSLTRRTGARPATPFLDGLRARAITFERAYATECWTLPTHLSMFTGLLPSEHGAHFQTMAYRRPQPTLAELAARAGHHTEVITRNSIFDGTLPGATRGFAVNVRVLAELGGMSTAAVGMVLALAKPRLRRLRSDSGFFHVLQRERRDFITTLARMGIPADRGVLTRALERMQDWRRRGTPYFLFLNLYDVHAPYSPSNTTPLRSWRTWRGWVENLQLPVLLPRVSTHAYLKPGFRMSARGRAILPDRHHC